jgi:hypothetical protein
MQHALAQEIKTGTTIALALEQHAPGYVPFHVAAVPFSRERDVHGSVVASNARRNAAKRSDATRPVAALADWLGRRQGACGAW